MRWWAALFLANLIVEVNSCYLFTSASTTSTQRRPLLCVFLPSQTFNGDFSSKIPSLSAVGAVHCAQQKNRQRKKEWKRRRDCEFFAVAGGILEWKKKMVKNLKLSIFLVFFLLWHLRRSSKCHQRDDDEEKVKPFFCAVLNMIFLVQF